MATTTTTTADGLFTAVVVGDVCLPCFHGFSSLLCLTYSAFLLLPLFYTAYPVDWTSAQPRHSRAFWFVCACVVEFRHDASIYVATASRISAIDTKKKGSRAKSRWWTFKALSRVERLVQYGDKIRFVLSYFLFFPVPSSPRPRHDLETQQHRDS